MPLGLLLLSRGQVTGEQLKRALDRQATEGGRIGEVLQALGYVNEAQVTSALAIQCGCPVFSMNGMALRLSFSVPGELVEEYRFLPIRAGADNRLLIGFEGGVDHQLLHGIEYMLGSPATPCIISSTDYRRLADAFRPNIAQNIRFAGMSWADIASTLSNYVVQIGAEGGQFTMVHDVLWARLSVEQKYLDLFFRGIR